MSNLIMESPLKISLVSPDATHFLRDISKENSAAAGGDVELLDQMEVA